MCLLLDPLVLDDGETDEDETGATDPALDDAEIVALLDDAEAELEGVISPSELQQALVGDAGIAESLKQSAIFEYRHSED